MEGEVFELCLEAVDSQPPAMRGVDVLGFLGDFDLGLGRKILQGAHVVEPIGQA